MEYKLELTNARLTNFSTQNINKIKLIKIFFPCFSLQNSKSKWEKLKANDLLT